MRVAQNLMPIPTSQRCWYLAWLLREIAFLTYGNAIIIFWVNCSLNSSLVAYSFHFIFLSIIGQAICCFNNNVKKVGGFFAQLYLMGYAT